MRPRACSCISFLCVCACLRVRVCFRDLLSLLHFASFCIFARLFCFARHSSCFISAQNNCVQSRADNRYLPRVQFTSVPADYTVECSDDMPMEDAMASDNCGRPTPTTELQDLTSWQCRLRQSIYELQRIISKSHDCSFI